MGCNYYATKIATEKVVFEIIEKVKAREFDKVLNLLPQKIHIGKSSIGWMFLFNHNDWRYFGKSEKELKRFLKKCLIEDEYGEVYTFERFFYMVNSKQNQRKHSDIENLANEYFGYQFCTTTDYS